MDKEKRSEKDENTEIVRTIVVLAQTLWMDVVAEGVETNEQFVLHQKLGCENGHDYFFSKPVNTDGTEKIISETYGALISPKSDKADVKGTRRRRNCTHLESGRDNAGETNEPALTLFVQLKF